jgi:hypothetical protein
LTPEMVNVLVTLKENRAMVDWSIDEDMISSDTPYVAIALSMKSKLFLISKPSSTYALLEK